MGFEEVMGDLQILNCALVKRDSIQQMRIHSRSQTARTQIVISNIDFASDQTMALPMSISTSSWMGSATSTCSIYTPAFPDLGKGGRRRGWNLRLYESFIDANVD